MNTRKTQPLAFVHNIPRNYNKLRNTLLKREKDTGFSIVEMTIALAIIMIITAISVVGFSNYRKANIDSSVQTDVRSAVVKVETWKSLNPRGVPSEATIAGITPSEPETTIHITPLPNGEYEIRGCNIKGKSTVPDKSNANSCTNGFGYVYNSINDHL